MLLTLDEAPNLHPFPYCLKHILQERDLPSRLVCCRVSVQGSRVRFLEVAVLSKGRGLDRLSDSWGRLNPKP